MNLSTGLIVTIVVVMIFYLRLVVRQRQKVKVAKIQYSAAEKARQKKKNAEPLDVQWGVLGVRVHNWWFVGAGIVLIVFGAVLAGTQFLGASLSSAWWVPLNAGILLMAFGVK